ncbi:MAG: tetraacyldisaccharide 4'-kinase [Phycisphaerae bacterium]|nr:tetraacyldisaccharide 4'-kinase [Phycisphaerae bacterium]
MPTAPMMSDHAPLLRGPAGSLASWLYGLEIARRNRRFDAGTGVVRLPIPVLSVGNLSVGGTGKTPLVALLAGGLTAGGIRCVIAMRGYAPRRSGGGRGRPEESDEARQYAELCPGVPVVANPDRASAVSAFLASADGSRTRCVILDDGFQHRRLARDLDIVLLDASRDAFGDRLLPAGWLREPVAGLGRAHVVVATHAEMVGPDDLERLDRAVRAVRGSGLDGVARHAWRGLVGPEGERGVGWLRGKRVLAACGIGNPRGFLLAVREAVAPGGSVIGERALRDHDAFTDQTVDEIIRSARAAKADAILVTEKDWAKLGSVGASRWPCAILRPALELRFDAGRPLDAERLIERAAGLVRDRSG